jgi:hypothetical protein
VNVAKQSQETHNDQVNRDDIVKQSRYHEDQDTGDQRHERADCQMDIHWHPAVMAKTYSFLSKARLTPPAIIASGANPKPLPPREKPGVLTGDWQAGTHPLKPRTKFLYLLFCLVTGYTVTLLDFAYQILAVAIGNLQIIVSKLPPLRLRLSGHLLPLSFELVFIHESLLVLQVIPINRLTRTTIIEQTQPTI